jgi:tetratricopeptide (TPR) repeat protein
MRHPLLILGIFTFIFGPPSSAEQGELAWQEGKYAKSLEYYRFALAEYPNQVEVVSYNMGQCFLVQKQSDSAIFYYQKVSAKNTPLVASDALSNHAVLVATAPPKKAAAQDTSGTAGSGTGAEAPPANEKDQAIDQALQLLRQALRSNPHNEIARYNYELLMKRKQQQEDNQQNQPPPPEEQEEEQEKEKQDRNTQNQPQQRPSEMQSAPSDPVDERQADQLMEALKENEKRFLQQLKKKPHRQPQQDDRPQW